MEIFRSKLFRSNQWKHSRLNHFDFCMWVYYLASTIGGTMILLEIIKFLAAMIVITFLLVVLIAIIMGDWETYKKHEQKNQEKEG